MDIVTPPPTSVYLYYDQHGILIYVGITNRGIKRQVEHNDTKAWWPFVARQEVEHFATRLEALARERKLIEKHSPPFNTQHNREARKVREAYLLFVAAHSQPLAVADIVRSLGRQLPLEPHEFGGHPNVVLRTRMDEALLAAVLRMPDGEQPKVNGLQRGKKAVARVIRLEKAGPFALLHLSRGSGHPIKKGTASIKFDNRQNLILGSVQVVLDHSDTSLCNPRCPKPQRVQWIRPDGAGAA